MKRLLPEIDKGTRIEYITSPIAGSIRTEVVVRRIGNKITVKDAAGERRRISIEQVRGYWKPRIKAHPKNKIVCQRGMTK